MPYSNPTTAQIHHIWQGMKQHCYDPNHTNYSYYGGKGITICDDWLANAKTFITWAVDNGYQHGLQIERINNNKAYSPENCTWATPSAQIRHRSNTHLLTAFGKTKCLYDWSMDKRCLINYGGLLKRLQKGMDPEEAITKPSQKTQT